MEAEEKNLHQLLVDKLSTKIDHFDIPSWFVNLSKCGTVFAWKTCKDCQSEDALSYRCSQKWCPRCNWRITAARAEKLRTWTKYVQHPMHLVLTQKNFQTVTPQRLKENVQNIARVRRLTCMREVQGGCVSIEMTNRITEGWHLHSHWLVDSAFVSMKELAQGWGRLVGQRFAIVHYNNSKDKSFVQEVCKYVCKPSEMVQWTADEIMQFIESSRGRRFFFCFGNLFKAGAAIRAEIEAKTSSPECTCSQCKSPAVSIRVNKWCAENSHNRARAMCSRFA